MCAEADRTAEFWRPPGDDKAGKKVHLAAPGEPSVSSPGFSTVQTLGRSPTLPSSTMASLLAIAVGGDDGNMKRTRGDGVKPIDTAGRKGSVCGST